MISACYKGLALKISPDPSHHRRANETATCWLPVQKILTKTSFIQFIIRKIRYSFEYFRHAHGTKTYIQARKMMPIKLYTAFLKKINQKTFAVFLKILFFYVYVLHVYTWATGDARGRQKWAPTHQLSRSGVTDSCELHCGCWKPHRGPLHKQQVFLTVPSCQPHLLFSLTNIY